MIQAIHGLVPDFSYFTYDNNVEWMNATSLNDIQKGQTREVAITVRSGPPNLVGMQRILTANADAMAALMITSSQTCKVTTLKIIDGRFIHTYKFFKTE